MNLRYLPPVAATVGLGKILAGRVRVNRKRVGEVLLAEDGEGHQVFREISVDPGRPVPPDSAATLTLRFRFARFSQAVNKGLSLLPIPVIIGTPGFLRKTWTFSTRTGYSRGIYLFDSALQAEAYRHSPIIRILEKRTVPGTFTWQLAEGDWIRGKGPESTPSNERKVTKDE